MSPPHVGLPGPVSPNGVTTPTFGLAAIIVGISDPSIPAPPPRVLFIEQAGRHCLQMWLPDFGATASAHRRTPPISPSAAFLPSYKFVATTIGSVAKSARSISFSNFFTICSIYNDTFFDFASDYDVVLPRIFSTHFIYIMGQRLRSKLLCHTYFMGRFLTLESSFSSLIRILYDSKFVTLSLPQSSHTYPFPVGFSRVPLSIPISTSLRRIARAYTSTSRKIYYKSTVCLKANNTQLTCNIFSGT